MSFIAYPRYVTQAVNRRQLDRRITLPRSRITQVTETNMPQPITYEKSGTVALKLTASGKAEVIRPIDPVRAFRGIAGLRTAHIMILSETAYATWILDEQGKLVDGGVGLTEEDEG